jgi:hypothetical protein
MHNSWKGNAGEKVVFKYSVLPFPLRYPNSGHPNGNGSFNRFP